MGVGALLFSVNRCGCPSDKFKFVWVHLFYVEISLGGLGFCVNKCGLSMLILNGSWCTSILCK